MDRKENKQRSSRARDHVRARFEEVEASIRKGDVGAAIPVLKSIRIPRTADPDLSLTAANLYRRCGMASRALQLAAAHALKGDQLRPATPEILLEYAHCLLQLNAQTSVGRILKDSSLRQHPRTLYLLGLLRMHEWNYPEAIAPLEKFTHLTEPEQYDHWVARLNLLASRIGAKDYDRAFSELEPLQKEFERRGFLRLLFNSTELEVQALAAQGFLKKAESAAARVAESGLRALGTLDFMYMEKWRLFAQARKHPQETQRKIRSLRERALGPGYSELRRDLDLHYYSHKKATRELKWMYFSTPSSNYRERILEESRIEAPTSAIWTFGGKTKSTPASIDLSEWLREKSFSMPAKTLVALLRDGYREPSLLEVFDSVYSDSYLNPATYARNVHQLFHRLRTELQNDRLPIAIAVNDGRYRLVHVRRPVEIVVDTLPDLLLKTSFSDDLLCSLAPHLKEPRSIREINTLLKEPLRSTQLRVQSWREAGRLQVLGTGRSTRYLLA
jgi:hypothetical protein